MSRRILNFCFQSILLVYCAQSSKMASVDDEDVLGDGLADGEQLDYGWEEEVQQTDAIFDQESGAYDQVAEADRHESDEHVAAGSVEEEPEEGAADLESSSSGQNLKVCMPVNQISRFTALSSFTLPLAPAANRSARWQQRSHISA